MNTLKKYKWSILITTLIVVIIVMFVYIQIQYNNAFYKNIQINIQGNTPFIVENDIRNIISNRGRYSLMSIPVWAINLNAVEEKIKKNLWVREAHVYRDAQGILHIDIVQKKPAMRIFSLDGKSFYMDDEGNRIPLSLYSVANVPICTSYPSYFNKNKDKVFVSDVLDLLTLAGQDDYLKNCISYINVMDTACIEIIPKMGTPIVRMRLQDPKEKILNKIKNFYLQIIPNVGWDFYTYIDLRFENEIIALKKQV